ncbi:MAG: geranylgeranyl diphosphate synthase type II [Gammaproteobacteria bacterium]|jgi:geranylgeranyl diphosphate synthase type II
MAYSFEEYLHLNKLRANLALKKYVGSFESPYSTIDSSEYLNKLQSAIEYSLLNNGKRIRAILVYAVAQSLDPSCQLQPSGSATDDNDLDRVASSVEMLHTYSLIHDDLPAMDDDDLRRGQATCHKAFDEATAILAGDALHSRAFEILTELEHCEPRIQLKLLAALATAAGQRGMVGGQAIDLGAVDQDINIQQLETIHFLKTGALIRAAVAMGANYANANPEQLKSLDSYAQAIGLAFQVQDDILDVEGDTLTLGKSQGADIALNKPTYPSLLGLENAKTKAQELHTQAIESLVGLGESATPLRDLSAYIISRNR